MLVVDTLCQGQLVAWPLQPFAASKIYIDWDRIIENTGGLAEPAVDNVAVDNVGMKTNTVEGDSAHYSH